MKVWLTYYHSYINDDGYPLGAYSSAELAYAAIDTFTEARKIPWRIGDLSSEYYVEEHEIDAPIADPFGAKS